MNGDVTVRDVMTREFVGVSEGDTMAGVADLMLDAGVDGAVVLRGSEPVGTIDVRHAIAMIADRRDPTEETAGSVMAAPAPTIAADSPVGEAMSTFASGEARRLVVVDPADVIGTLSEHDLITAQATFPAEESPAESLAVPAADGAGAGAGADRDRFSTQSVCEGCGSLAGNLANVNGQLLCADCREL